MADKLLKSIKFPMLPDRYVIGDSTLTEEGAAADAKATGDEITNVKSAINDIIVSYDTLKPYLYKENVYINESYIETALNGWDTFRIPLNAFDILHLSWDSPFWGGLAMRFVYTAEMSDLSMEHPTSGSTESYGYFQSEINESIWLGEISQISNVKAIYVTAKHDLVSNVRVSINKPSMSFANDIQSAKDLNSVTSIESLIYYRPLENLFFQFASPYFVTYAKLKQGDTVYINKTIAGVSGVGFVFSDDGATTIYDRQFTATQDCVIGIYNNSTISGNIVVNPVESIKIFSNNIIGEINANNQFSGLSGVAFGTSLTYRAQTTYGFLTKLSELSGITFDNQGIGSSTIKGSMLTAIKNYSGYSGKRICLLEGFVNDWYNGLPLGVYTDTTEDTVCGCVRVALNYMLSQNANMAVFMILDHYGRNVSSVDCSTTAENGNGLTQYEYYEEIAKVAESLGIPAIKEYEISQISENTPQYLADNIHCNALGAIQSAYAIWSQMKQYYPNQI